MTLCFGFTREPRHRFAVINCCSLSCTRVAPDHFPHFLSLTNPSQPNPTRLGSPSISRIGSEQSTIKHHSATLPITTLSTTKPFVTPLSASRVLHLSLPFLSASYRVLFDGISRQNRHRVSARGIPRV